MITLVYSCITTNFIGRCFIPSSSGFPRNTNYSLVSIAPTGLQHKKSCTVQTFYCSTTYVQLTESFVLFLYHKLLKNRATSALQLHIQKTSAALIHFLYKRDRSSHLVFFLIFRLSLVRFLFFESNQRKSYTLGGTFKCQAAGTKTGRIPLKLIILYKD